MSAPPVRIPDAWDLDPKANDPSPFAPCDRCGEDGSPVRLTLRREGAICPRCCWLLDWGGGAR